MSGIRWTQKHVDDLVKAGKIRNVVYTTPKRDKSKKADKVPPATPQQILFIQGVLERAGIAYETEYRFDTKRKFRFDLALPEMMMAIEYEGLVATGRKGGHQTKKHFTKDCTKYNLAASLGWTVYRYTALNYKDFENDLKKIFNDNNE